MDKRRASERDRAAIRPALRSDEAEWRALWAAYCDFYGAKLSEAVTASTWQRICDPASRVKAIVARPGGRVAAFATYVVHDNTWETQPICYLEDLYVAPEARNAGLATSLIGWLADAMDREGWARLYWMSRGDNATARSVYERITPADGFVRYVIRK